VHKITLIYFKKLIVFVSLLSLAACSTLFSQKPVDFYEGDKRDSNNVSLIRGQAYMESVGNWVEVHIKEVDGKEVYNDITTLLPPYIVNVAPGSHELAIVGLLGNSAFYYEHDKLKLPKVSGNFEPGKAYQILFDLISENGKPESAVYRIVPIGTISQYNEFLIKNPDHKLGYPIPTIIGK
jgi:hypothetical protein